MYCRGTYKVDSIKIIRGFFDEIPSIWLPILMHLECTEEFKFLLFFSNQNAGTIGTNAGIVWSRDWRRLKAQVVRF